MNDYLSHDTGWRRDAGATRDFTLRGKDLVVELRPWAANETCVYAPSPDLPEELGSVLEGEFELTCGDERHLLKAGMCILVPPREAHTWRALTANAVLYRVFGPRPRA